MGSDCFLPFLLVLVVISPRVQNSSASGRVKNCSENSTWAVTGLGAPITHPLETKKVVTRQAMPGLRLRPLQSKSAKSTKQKGCVRLSTAAMNHRLAASEMQSWHPILPEPTGNSSLRSPPARDGVEGGGRQPAQAQLRDWVSAARSRAGPCQTPRSRGPRLSPCS